MKGKNIPHLFFTSIISPWTHALLTLGHIDHYSNPFHQFTHKVPVIQLKDKIDFLQKIFWCLTLKICTRPLDLLIFDSHWFTGLGLQISEVSWSLLKKNIILLSDWDIIKKKNHINVVEKNWCEYINGRKLIDICYMCLNNWFGNLKQKTVTGINLHSEHLPYC